MLNDGAHIRLDGDSFHLDKAIERHYDHHYVELQVDDPSISGSPGNQHYKEGSLFWGYDDWAGGEGNKIYRPSDFDVYKISGAMNPRLRGQLSGRPNRLRISVDGTDVRLKPFLDIAEDKVFMAGGLDIFYSDVPVTTFTQIASADVGLAALSANYKITATVGDESFLYFAAFHSGSSGTRIIRRINSTEPTATNTTIETENTNSAAAAGLGILNGKLYMWTGRKLFEQDLDQGFPVVLNETQRKLYDTGTNPATASVFGNQWFAGLCTTEKEVVFFYSTQFTAQAYILEAGVARPFWQPAPGFVIKGVAYHGGVVFFSGHFGGTNGYGEIWAIPLDSQRPMHLKDVRRASGLYLQMQLTVGSYGADVLSIAERNGLIFIYNMETDGLSLLDDMDRSSGSDPDGLQFINLDHRIGGAVSFGDKRVVSVYRPGAAAADTENYQVAIYDDDEPGNREQAFNTTDYTGLTPYFETPAWHYGYPMEQKTLIGFHLTFVPLVTNQTIQVSYSLDQGENFTSLTAITSATTGASTVGRVFQQVSASGSQKKFHNLMFRVSLTSSSTAKAPILYTAYAEAALTRKQEEWEVVVRVKDEQSRNRITGRQVHGHTIRDWLLETVESGNVVTLLDGYRYSGRNEYATHSVLIKEANDLINQPGEGSMRLLIRSVDGAD